MSDLADKLKALPVKARARGRGSLFSDDEWRDIIAAHDRGVSARTLHESLGRSKNLDAFRQALRGARACLRANGRLQ
jgi:hypothetical protein